MKLLSVSVLLLFATFAFFFIKIPIVASGFGILVGTGGIETIRAEHQGRVTNFASTKGQFLPGEIVTVVHPLDMRRDNDLTFSTFRSEIAKINADHAKKQADISIEEARKRAKYLAVSASIDGLKSLLSKNSKVLQNLKDFSRENDPEIMEIMEDQKDQLENQEKILSDLSQTSLISRQKQASLQEKLQTSRVAVLNSERTLRLSKKSEFDLEDNIEKLKYELTTGIAEKEALASEAQALHRELIDLRALNEIQLEESRNKYLSKKVYPQVEIAKGRVGDIRALSPDLSVVNYGEPLRLIEGSQSTNGLSIIAFGIPASGFIELSYEEKKVSLSMPIEESNVRSEFEKIGWRVKHLWSHDYYVENAPIVSWYVEFDVATKNVPSGTNASVLSSKGDPIFVQINQLRNLVPGDQPKEYRVIGFLENEISAGLSKHQLVKGRFKDSASGRNLFFEARVLNRENRAVDTEELAKRLGNRSVAQKIISKGIISQVNLKLEENSGAELIDKTGAVVNLKFFFTRQSLFEFLVQ